METTRITVPDLGRMKAAGERITMVTAYDWTFARLLEAAGVELLLVGDSLGNVVQGHETTLPVTLDEMVYHTRLVTRGASRALVVGDLPFGSYQSSPERAAESAIRLVKEGGAQAVKLEGGVTMAAAIEAIARMDVPVMGHVGLTPQSINTIGSFRAQGRDEADWEPIEADAMAVADAGAFAVVIEAVAEPLGRHISQQVPIPTIGIGASAACDGQILVLEDMLGLSPRVPKFVKRYGDLGPGIEKAIADYAKEVRARTFPSADHVYTMRAKPRK
jgi:3-methyl-2-oxobutanoate hydroxymethyltransferase